MVVVVVVDVVMVVAGRQAERQARLIGFDLAIDRGSAEKVLFTKVKGCEEIPSIPPSPSSALRHCGNFLPSHARAHTHTHSQHTRSQIDFTRKTEAVTGSRVYFVSAHHLLLQPIARKPFS